MILQYLLMTGIMIFTSYNSGLTNGKWSLILILLNRRLKFYFLVKKSSTNNPQLIFNGIAVAKVNDQKHLGLILDSRLSCEKHLNEKIRKAKTRN